MQRKSLPRALRLGLVLGAVVVVLLSAIALWLRSEDRAARDFARAATGLRAGITVRELFAQLPDRRGESGVYGDAERVAVLAPFATARRWFCVWYQVRPEPGQMPDSQAIEAVRVYEVAPRFGMRGRRRDEHIRASVHAAVLRGSYPGVRLLHEASLGDTEEEATVSMPNPERERSEPGE